MAKFNVKICRFFRPSPQRLINYLSGLQGLPINELEKQLYDLYSVDCCNVASFASLRSLREINLSSEDDFAKQMTAMVQQIWNDKAMPQGLINKEVTTEFAKQLWQGVS